jgi:hypothetical protein
MIMRFASERVLSDRGSLFLPKPNYQRLKLMSLLVPKVNVKLNLNVVIQFLTHLFYKIFGKSKNSEKQ